MKKYLTLYAAVLFTLATVAEPKADPKTEAKDYPLGMIEFKGAEIWQVLPIYSDLTGKKLSIEPGVTNQHARINLKTTNSVTRAEGIKLFEDALRKQANIVIESIDEKHAKVKLVKK